MYFNTTTNTHFFASTYVVLIKLHTKLKRVQLNIEPLLKPQEYYWIISDLQNYDTASSVYLFFYFKAFYDFFFATIYYFISSFGAGNIYYI